MFNRAIKKIERLGRFREIITTLAEYGFEPLLSQLHLPGIRLLLKHLPTKGESLDINQRILAVMEELGPTFIKFGQMLSVRPDLVPASLIEQLSKLQDQARPVEFSEIKPAIEQALDTNLDNVFSEFDERPLASASLSQVHVAVLRSSQRSVCVKVRRPNIDRQVEEDMRILGFLARKIHEHVRELRIYNLPAVVEVMHKTMLHELDFTREAQHIRIARSYLDKNDAVVIPEQIDEFCKKTVLTTARVQGGIKVHDSELPPDERLRLARAGLKSTLKQTLVDGFFHADAHPGNVLVTRQNKLALLDWGMAGRLTKTDQQQLLQLLKAIVNHDSQRIMDALAIITGASEISDNRELERDLLDLLDSHCAARLEDMQVGQLLIRATFLLAHHNVQLPPEHVLMVKALLTSEGTARKLCPDINIVKATKDALHELKLGPISPRRQLKSLFDTLAHVKALHKNLPGRIARIMEHMEKGVFAMRFEHENLEGLQHTFEKASNRLTFGIIIGALIIGSSMIITTGVKPLIFGYPALGLIGYSISAAMGMVLIISILRSK